MGNLFTVDNLAKCFGGEDVLQQYTIDAGVNFLNGKVTSTMSSITADKTKIIYVDIIDKKTGKKTFSRTFTVKEKADEFVEDNRKERQNNLNESAKSKGEVPESVDDLYEYKVYEKEQGSLSTLTGAGVGVLGTVGSAQTLAMTYGRNPEILEEFATNIALEVTNMLVEQSMKIINDSTTKIISKVNSAPNRIKQIAQKKFDEEKKTLGEVMADLTGNTEDQVAEQNEKNEQEEEEQNKSAFLDTLNLIKTKTVQASAEINTVMQKITPYLSEGPEIVTSMINNAVTDQISKLEGEVNTKLNEKIKLFDDWCKRRGEDMGEKLAKEYNKLLEKQGRRIMQQAEQTKSKASNMAFSALQKGKLKIMALTGVNIPV